MRWLVLLLLSGCSDSLISPIRDGEESPEQEETPEVEDTANYEDTGTNTDTGGEVDTDPPEHTLLVCSVDTMVHMVGSGTQDCPEDYAAFMMDDGRGPNFICCPLPSTDILVDEPPVERGSACGPDEVISGFKGQYEYRCTGINRDRYQLGSTQKPCYFGSGAAGGSGAPGCASHPHTWDVLQEKLFGSDGCSGYPYGSLFVSQSNKYCKDMRTVQVQYTGTVAGDPSAGTPVDMFAE